MKSPLRLVSGEPTIALTLSCSVGRPDAPPESRVTGNTVQAGYAVQGP